MPFEVQSAPKTKTKKTVRTIEVQTSDEMMLVGTLTVPPKATIKEKAPLVILLHSLGSDRTIYKSLSEKLKEKCLFCTKCPLFCTRMNVVFSDGNENGD